MKKTIKDQEKPINVRFQEKYVSSTAKAEEKEGKIEISTDFYALGEIIQDLINKLEHIRKG